MKKVKNLVVFIKFNGKYDCRADLIICQIIFEMILESLEVGFENKRLKRS